MSLETGQVAAVSIFLLSLSKLQVPRELWAPVTAEVGSPASTNLSLPLNVFEHGQLTSQESDLVSTLDGHIHRLWLIINASLYRDRCAVLHFGTTPLIYLYWKGHK